jgi:hypothetical protein
MQERDLVLGLFRAKIQHEMSLRECAERPRITFRAHTWVGIELIKTIQSKQFFAIEAQGGSLSQNLRTRVQESLAAIARMISVHEPGLVRG